jgi:hypothetical protein
MQGFELSFPHNADEDRIASRSFRSWTVLIMKCICWVADCARWGSHSLYRLRQQSVSGTGLKIVLCGCRECKGDTSMHVCFEPENYFLYKRLLEGVSAAYAHRVGGNFAMIAETAYSWDRQVPRVEKHFLWRILSSGMWRRIVWQSSIL